MPWARRVTLGLAVLTGGHLVAGLFFLAGVGSGTAFVDAALLVTLAPLTTGLSLLVARRRTGALVAVLLGVLSLALANTIVKELWLLWLPTTGHPADWAWLVAVWRDPWWIFAAFALLLLYFPDGRLPSPRWRWVPPVLLVCTLSPQVIAAYDQTPFRAPLQDLPRPFGPAPLWAEVVGWAFWPMLALILACAVSLVVRFRRADEVGRQQIKWLALAGMGVPLYPILCLVEIVLTGEPQWFSTVVALASLVGTPVAVAVAILRHDLYDVDKALATAVTWGLVTALLLATYAAVSSATGLAVGRDSHVGTALGTAVAALLLLPALRGVRRVVDARMYPLRRAALAAVERLHREVSAGQARPEELQATLRTALRDPGLRVGFRVPGTEDYLDASGRPLAGAGGVPVLLDEERTGVLVPDHGPATPELLREVAGRCSTLVEVVRLRSEVALALREAESSRARLLEIGYAERRRMERDLHDGAQQRLVSLGMQLRLAQRRLGDGTVDVDDLLDQSVAELGSAVAELRQLAHGLRPSSLDDGLPAALAHLVRSLPLAVDMRIEEADVPDAVATTAYYVASEAITNAVKHAEATRIVLEVARSDDRLLVRITDDGRGGARLGVRSGLVDRVAALGGSLRVQSPAGHGTEVEVSLPCAS